LYTEPHKNRKPFAQTGIAPNPDNWDTFTAWLDANGYGPPEPEPKKPHTHSCDLRRFWPQALDPLIGLPNFVVWRWTWKPDGGPDKKGKWDKPPSMARNPSRFAKTNTPATWGTYEQALTAVETSKADGLGFCLLGTQFCAFDIDDCCDPATGAIDPMARALVDRAKTYAEVTVSGAGIRIIGLGSDRSVHTKKKVKGSKVSIEVYRNCERYITISGAQMLRTAHRLADIDGLIDQVLLELGEQPSAPPKNDPPHTGEDGDEPPADEATLAIMEAMLPPELRELIENGVAEPNRSTEFISAVNKLRRSKWCLVDIIALFKKYPNGIAEKYKGRIAKETKRAFDRPDKEQQSDDEGEKPTDDKPADSKSKKKSSLIYFNDAVNEEVSKEWIIKDVIAKDETSSWIGPPKSGKSAIATDLCISVAAGADWRG
jgi:Uncharacterized conserved protein